MGYPESSGAPAAALARPTTADGSDGPYSGMMAASSFDVIGAQVGQTGSLGAPQLGIGIDNVPVGDDFIYQVAPVTEPDPIIITTTPTQFPFEINVGPGATNVVSGLYTDTPLVANLENFLQAYIFDVYDHDGVQLTGVAATNAALLTVVFKNGTVRTARFGSVPIDTSVISGDWVNFRVAFTAAAKRADCMLNWSAVS